MTAPGTGRQSKYERVYDQLRDRVHTRLQPHDSLPGERELMQEFGVSRITIRQALTRLQDEGLVYRIHGSGTYVSETGMVSKSLRLASFSEDMRERGLTPTTVVISATVERADAEVARDLRIPPGKDVITVRRLRLANQMPMALEQVDIPARMAPGLDSLDLTGSLYATLDERYGLRIERALQIIQASVANTEEAGLLGVAPYSPVLVVRRVGTDRRELRIERATTLYRADRYEFQFAVSREP